MNLQKCNHKHNVSTRQWHQFIGAFIRNEKRRRRNEHSKWIGSFRNIPDYCCYYNKIQSRTMYYINAKLEMTIIRFIHMQSVLKFVKFYSFIVEIFPFYGLCRHQNPFVCHAMLCTRMINNSMLRLGIEKMCVDVEHFKLSGWVKWKFAVCRFSNFFQLYLKHAYN